MDSVNSTGLKGKNWFKSWFNSPYYHILYKDRNTKEAEQFLENLLTHLHLPDKSRILDVACGKGRHAIFLSKKGFDVTGFDLSKESIQYDKQFENENLKFFVHDMRNLFRTNYFDLVINLFSSFGYFDNEHENVRSLHMSAQAMKPGGKFIFDYFNAEKVRLAGNLVMEKTVDHIKFNIQKKISENFICKRIRFSDAGKDFTFEEHVLLLTMPDLESYFQKAGLHIENRFGNYNLDPFSDKNSERIILIATKA